MNRTRTIVVAFSTLDGIIQDPAGSEGTPAGGWVFRNGPEAVAGDRFKLGPTLDSGVLVLGRRTWEQFAQIFPSRTGEFDVAMNRVPKLVASRTLTDLSAFPTSSLMDGDLAQAVELANASQYGLGASVFAGNKKEAMSAARRLRAGMTAINGVMSYAGIPSLPFGGSGDSGFGRIHGADGLREFARPRSIARQRMKPLANLTSFTRTDQDVKKVLTMATVLHGRRYRKP